MAAFVSKSATFGRFYWPPSCRNPLPHSNFQKAKKRELEVVQEPIDEMIQEFESEFEAEEEMDEIAHAPPPSQMGDEDFTP